MTLVESALKVCPVCGVRRSARFFRGDRCILCAQDEEERAKAQGKVS